MASRGPAQSSSSDLKAFSSVRLPPPQAPQAFVPIASFSPAPDTVRHAESSVPAPNGSSAPIATLAPVDTEKQFSTPRKSSTHEGGGAAAHFTPSTTGASQTPSSVVRDISGAESLLNGVGPLGEVREVLEAKSQRMVQERNGFQFDRYGFAIGTGEGESPAKSVLVPASPAAKAAAAKENERLFKWLKMLQNWPSEEQKNPRMVRRRMIKGIPDAVRGQAWQVISGSRDVMKANLSLYQRVALLGGSDQEDQVIKDLNRTFPKHHQFVSRDGMGQQSLFNILKAHVVYSPNVGYCQGMGFVASFLLFYMTEEEAFWLLTKLIYDYKLGTIYMSGLPGYQRSCFVFQELLKEHMPQLHQHLDTMGVMPVLYLTQWFMTMFLYYTPSAMPFDLVLRIWDIFIISKGSWKIIYRVALMIHKLLERKLLALKCDFLSMSDACTLLKDPDVCSSLSTDDAIQLCYTFKIKQARLDALNSEYDKDHGPIDMGSPVPP